MGKRLRLAQQETEEKSVAGIAQAFEKVVMDRRVLPGTNEWVELLRADLDQPVERIRVSQSGCPRLVLYHPASAIKPGGSSVIQTASGFQSPAETIDRVIVVSTLEEAFPTNFNPGSVDAFNALWNAKSRERPSGWSAAALRDPDDLHLAKVDLSRLLHRVVINILTTTNPAAVISLDSNGTTLTIPKTSPSTPWRRSFIHGTGLNLHGPDGQISIREIINEDRTLYFTDAGWGRPGGNSFNSIVATYVRDFLNASFPQAKNLQRPRAAVDELYRSLWSYMDWSYAGFIEGGNNKNQAPDVYVVRSTVARLNQGTLNLIGGGGSGGN